ncbi:MAG: type II toxin-antitoxin system RelE/ParE family toxin [Ruminococcus sp.]|nr:type II toxin-antitoxin system RelE/ParE family toxin [Ruminococcus sp.]
MKIIFTKKARLDLKEIHDYIEYKLLNPYSAKAVTDRIVQSCYRLMQMPNMGISMKAKTGIETDYRCLICGNYIAFYTIENQAVRIERILDGRTEYMKVIFDSVYPTAF